MRNNKNLSPKINKIIDDLVREMLSGKYHWPTVRYEIYHRVMVGAMLKCDGVASGAARIIGTVPSQAQKWRNRFDANTRKLIGPREGDGGGSGDGIDS